MWSSSCSLQHQLIDIWTLLNHKPWSTAAEIWHSTLTSVQVWILGVQVLGFCQTTQQSSESLHAINPSPPKENHSRTLVITLHRFSCCKSIKYFFHILVFGGHLLFILYIPFTSLSSFSVSNHLNDFADHEAPSVCNINNHLCHDQPASWEVSQTTWWTQQHITAFNRSMWTLTRTAASAGASPHYAHSAN